MSELREAIVTEARSWVGVPWRHAGRDRYGIDCAGLVVKVANECGISDYDFKNYSRRPIPSQFLKMMKDNLLRVPKSRAGNGSVLVFREPSHPCHMGILEIDPTGARFVIHSYAPARKVIREPMTTERWNRCIMAFDYHGCEEE